MNQERCIACGREEASTHMARIEDGWLCPTCRDEAVQAVIEGKTGPGSIFTCWRHKKGIILMKGSELPQRCIICNGPASRRSRKISAQHGSVTGGSTTIAFPLCERHYKRYVFGMAGSLLSFVLGTLCFFGGIASANTLVSVFSLVAAVALGIGFFVCWIIFSHPLHGSIVPHKSDYFLVRSRGTAFTEGLPPFPED